LRHTLGWKFPGISDIADLRQTRCARKILNPVLETTLITKETTYTLEFGKYFVVSFWSHLIRAFSVLLEDSLRIISETWRAGTKLSTEYYLNLARGKNCVGLIFRTNFWNYFFHFRPVPLDKKKMLYIVSGIWIKE
jgi:hypothetical protein